MKIVKNIFSLQSATGLIPGLIIVALQFLVSCTGGISSMYDSNFPLTNETAMARTSKLTIKIPQGWFTAEDNENNLIDLWLIKDDYSATLNFISLSLDSASIRENRGDEIKGAVRFSQIFRKAKYGKTLKEFNNQELFEINKKQFAAYEYVDGTNRFIRVIIFSYGNKFYELSAIPVKTQNLKELYKVQNSILSSIN
jgi:hypothetical protein